ncbi:efflux RND transporter periplasmic adaptor subunit [Rubricoccus marinus]|uniref:Uncharacterized protein n=1 Tax=Rubricoccus marinus TaxID=716817 RepID=A0A259TUX8_9BACT|nr:HlyD family efflux transporter periplasmic adaptor subunit [Rubricoccus marinus]OZC01427.1 hypothetical protein BSZ36_17250 [Rubricoccus marinus]
MRRLPLSLPALALAAGLLVAGCGDGAPPETDADPVGQPPSLQRASGPAVVTLSDVQAAELSVETAEVQASGATVEVGMPGVAEPSPDDFAAVSAPVSGRVVRVLAHEGEAVRRGQTVAVLQSMETASLSASARQASAEAAQAEAGVAQAQAEVALQRQQVERYTQLVAERISPRMRLDQARADLGRAQAQLRAAQAAVAAAQARVTGSRDQLAAAGGGGRGGTVAVVAPRGGVIDRHTVDLGGSVMAYDEMMTIVGQGEVMVRGQATPDQAARVRAGDGVSVRSASDPGVAVASRVASVAPAASSSDRSVAVYVRVPAGRGIRPGQSVRLSVVARAEAGGVSVPLAAVSYDGDRATVFVQTGPRAFEQRPVELGAPGEEAVPVLSGLAVGDRVAVTNVFDLKALARFEAYGEE